MTHILYGLRIGLTCFVALCVAAAGIVAFGYIINTISEMGGG